MMILDLHRQGLTVAAIARETGQDRKTVRKYIARGRTGSQRRQRTERVPPGGETVEHGTEPLGIRNGAEPGRGQVVAGKLWLSRSFEVTGQRHESGRG